MNTYKIELKYIKNTESYIIAIFACIYEELKLRIKDRDLENIEKARKTIDNVMKGYRVAFKLQDNPAAFIDRFDLLETIEDATLLIKLQDNVNSLMELFDEKICIETVYRDEWPGNIDENMLPKFGEKIKLTYTDEEYEE